MLRIDSFRAGQVFSKELRLVRKEYTEAEADFVREWADKWFQIVDLLLCLLSHFDSPPFSPPHPDLDDNKYRRLCVWFREHEHQFKPLWKDYYESQDWALDPNDEEFADMSDSDKFLENPFHFAYRLENLSGLTQSFESKSYVATETREPIEQRAWDAAQDLIRIDARVIDFLDWVRDRTPDSSHLSD